MKRKRSEHTMRRILQHAASWLLFFTIATACRQDELLEETPSQEGESGQVTLMLQTDNIRKPTTRAWMGVTHHENIDNIAIMGCRVDADGVERIKFVAHGHKPQQIEQAPNAHSATVRMHLPAGWYSRLVVVTNAVEKFPHSLTNQPYDVLKGITYDMDGNGKFSYPVNPMYGELNSPVEFRQGEAKTLPGSITLARIVSFVQVRNLSKSTFRLERVHTNNIRTNTLIYYDLNNLNNGVPTLSPYDIRRDVAYDVPADEWADGMYIFEQPAASHLPGKSFNGVRIIAEGTLLSNGQKRFYPIDFVNHNGTAFVPVLRNHIYTFELHNITNNGYHSIWDAWIAKEILTNRVTPQGPATITMYNRYHRNIGFNDYHFVSTNAPEVQIRGGNLTAELWVYTDFPGGWYTYVPEWCTMSQDFGAAHTEAHLYITSTPTPVYRERRMWFYAGQLLVPVDIKQWP